MSIEAPTRVEYQLVEDDLRFVHQVLTGGSSKIPPMLRSMLFAGGIVFPLYPFIFLMLDGRFLDRPVITGYALTAATGLFFVWRIWRSIRRSFIDWASQPESRRHLQPATLTVSDDGIHHRTALTETRIAWPLITNIVRSEESRYVLMYLQPTMAFIIPARAFADRHAMDCFVEKASILQRQYVGATLECRQCGYDLRVNPDAGCPECGWMRKPTPDIPSNGS